MYSLFHAQSTWQLIPGFHQTNMVYCIKYVKFMILRHCCGFYFSGKMLRKMSCRRVPVIIVLYLLGYRLVLLFCNCLVYLDNFQPTQHYISCTLGKWKVHHSIRLRLQGMKPQLRLQLCCLCGRVSYRYATTFPINFRKSGRKENFGDWCWCSWLV